MLKIYTKLLLVFVLSAYAKENGASQINILQNINLETSSMSINSCDKYEYYRWISYNCMDDKTRSTNFSVDVYGYYKNPTNPNTYISEIVYTGIRLQKATLKDGTCLLEGADDWITDVPEYDKDDCYAYSFKDTFGYHKTPASGVYNNYYSCSTYSE